MLSARKPTYPKALMAGPEKRSGDSVVQRDGGVPQSFDVDARACGDELLAQRKFLRRVDRFHAMQAVFLQMEYAKAL